MKSHAVQSIFLDQMKVQSIEVDKCRIEDDNAVLRWVEIAIHKTQKLNDRYVGNKVK